MVTRVKICGLTRLEDAVAAVEYGADALGFIRDSSSPRYFENREELDELVSQIPVFVTTVAVFGTLGMKDGKPPTTAVQAETYDKVFGRYTSKLHVIRPRPGATAQDVLKACLPYDGLVLDGFHPDKRGGSGVLVDWDLAAEVVRLSPRPVILAGGLTPDNVGQAIERVRPFAVDVSSGVESSPGIKDRIKMRDFIQSAKTMR